MAFQKFWKVVAANKLDLLTHFSPDSERSERCSKLNSSSIEFPVISDLLHPLIFYVYLTMSIYFFIRKPNSGVEGRMRSAFSVFLKEIDVILFCPDFLRLSTHVPHVAWVLTIGQWGSKIKRRSKAQYSHSPRLRTRELILRRGRYLWLFGTTDYFGIVEQ